MDTVSQDFYYQTRDEIFAATCQIYLENQYTREQYEAETERLRNLEFSYQDQTNMLYQDEENYPKHEIDRKAKVTLKLVNNEFSGEKMYEVTAISYIKD